MYDATSTTPARPLVTAPDLTSFARVDVLGLEVVAQQVWPDRAVLFCELAAIDDRCPACGIPGQPHDRVRRRFTHLPVGRRATWLHVMVPRFRCAECGRLWRHPLTTVARPRSKLTRAADWWALCQVVLDHAPISGVAAVLGVSWDTANTAVSEVGTRVLIEHPGRLDGVEVIGVDEHAWRHTRKGDKYVTVIIDLTPIRDGTGPARLLDLVEGRSKKAFKTWLDAQDEDFRAHVQIVAMDGFTGFKTAAAEAVPEATAVMDPFHVVALAGDKLNQTRQRVQRDLTGSRGRRDDPLYRARRTLRTGRALLTDKQKTRLEALWAIDDLAAVEVTWCVYQDLIDAYRHPEPALGKKLLATVIDRIKTGVPAGLDELAQLGRTLQQRRADILAFFDHPGSSNGPTEAINGRLEHLRGIALGFRNLINYRLRSLLEAGGFRPLIHSLS
ncbi:MAG: ISL3 family transposase [Micropruina sp.]|nr:MAG: ISL3 family transposase [Micropruina sp.]